MTDQQFVTELVNIDELRPHPRNYRSHPDDELDHIEASIRQHGIYKNVVIAADGTILAGHGVVQAAKERCGMTTIPVRRLPIAPDSPEAIAILTGDNEIGRLAEIDDRMLTELLKETKDATDSLLGTGFDETMLAALVLATRPAHEIPDINAAAEYVGETGWESPSTVYRLIMQFQSNEDKQRFIEKYGLHDNITAGKNSITTSAWWPNTEDVPRPHYSTALVDSHPATRPPDV